MYSIMLPLSFIMQWAFLAMIGSRLKFEKIFLIRALTVVFFSLSFSPIYTTKHLFITDVNKSGNDFNQGHNGII